MASERTKQRPQSETQMQARAIQRAISLGLAGEIERVSYGHYRLPSTTRPGVFWTVKVVGGRYVCVCEAGRSQRPCSHAAAVFIRKTECGGARVVGPATHAGEEAPSNVLQFAPRRAA